jgi:nitrate reductase gamma subunit
MSNFSTYLDQLLFAVLPYVAMSVFLIGTIRRYRAQPFTYSSLSSQLLENKQHFWAVVPFHYGIITLVVGHLIGFLVPGQVLAWNSQPLRLYILEISALAFGISSLVGLAAIVARRLTDPKVRVVTTIADWVVYALLAVSFFTGVYTAVFHRWGSSWFAVSASPYLWSLVKLKPDVATVSVLPWSAKFHIINAWLVFGFFPFSRLVHILVVPNHYLWRKTQVVRWYGVRMGAARGRG